jgi:hypothetical protein
MRGTLLKSRPSEASFCDVRHAGEFPKEPLKDAFSRPGVARGVTLEAIAHHLLKSVARILSAGLDFAVRHFQFGADAAARLMRL